MRFACIAFISVRGGRLHAVHARGGPRAAPRLVTHRDDDDTVPRDDSSRISGFTSRQSLGASGDDGGERRNRPRDCRRARNRMANARDLSRAHLQPRVRIGGLFPRERAIGSDFEELPRAVLKFCRDARVLGQPRVKLTRRICDGYLRWLSASRYPYRAKLDGIDLIAIKCDVASSATIIGLFVNIILQIIRRICGS